ncbi:MAG: PKD domain-containing protein [Candidatus Eisenbacteria bacterium]|uniref:PKD domain-containing protein n=2 Tax=Eiseniibacteriota bacterium TaxID=2212470 RepID=A0A538TEK9_UNCEI|nr:MAG: PKD domain-containing protein [Candidatus Eisenbacteria bacterium]
MRPTLRCLALGSLLLLALAAPAAAQYMRMTTDNPTDPTRLRASGTTIVTIFLDTDHDRNGTLQSCNSHTSAYCGGTGTTPQPLDMFSYTLALKAVGGTVTWGSFTPTDASYTETSPPLQSNTEVEINRTRPPGTFTPPGLATLGSITVTPVTGAPRIDVQIGASGINPFGFGTGFGTSCDGFFFPNTYVVGDPSDPCGVASGAGGDWFDWAGAGAPSLPNGAVLDPIGNMTIGVGGCSPASADQAIRATDPDGDPISFTSTGPTWMTVTANAQAGTTRTGNIHLSAPPAPASGTFAASVTATSGGGSDTRSFTITIATVDNTPILAQPANMTVFEGQVADQTITATACGAPLSFTKLTGPTFVTVTTTDPGTGTGTGNIHVAPPVNSQGTYIVTVRVSDGTQSNDKSLTLNVIHGDSAPVLIQPSNMAVNEGQVISQAIMATVSNLRPLTFSKASGPSFMTVTTTSPGAGTGTGEIRLAPSFSDAGTYSASVSVTDGTATDTKSFTITITNENRPPVLTQPANMTVLEGSTANQGVTATDAEGLALTFSKQAGPSFMSVTTTNPGTGTATGNINLAPGFSDSGTSVAVVRASDGTLADTKNISITVNNVDQPVSLAAINNMTLAAGSTADQAFTATDPDGDAITFTHTGPPFMTRTDNAQSGTTRTGNIHLAPSSTTSGSFAGSVTAAANGTTSTKSFTIIVCVGCESPPVLAQPANMTVLEGSAADQAIVATDPDGNALTFFAASGPTFMAVTTTNPGTGTATGNIRLAPGFSDQGTYRATVTASDGTLTDSKSLSIMVTDFACRPPLLAQPANMTVNEAQTADQTLSGTSPDGSPMTFTLAAGPTFVTVITTSPTTGNVHVAPEFSDAGSYVVTVRATVGGACAATVDKSFTVAVNNVNRPPTLDPIATVTVKEGATADVPVTASDPDNDPLTFSTDCGTFLFFDQVTRILHIAPGPNSAGTYTCSVTVSDGQASVTQSFLIIVLPAGNRCPTASPGGPYSGLAGVPVNFDGTASADPDGNPLTYAWDFDASDGITVDAVGVTVSHSYTAAGTYTVTLTVTDNGDGNPDQICSRSATTTATIAPACDATIFNGYDTIRLGSGKPFWFAYVQPATGCYNNSDVVISSFVMKYAGRQISASGKTAIGGDKSGDGIQEIKISFSKDDLRTLFTGTGLANGHNIVTVTLEASLAGGGKLSGTTQLDVVNNGSFNVAVSPNPMNPQATLTWTTSRTGFVRIEMFDIQGRLVRRLVDEAAMAAGGHEATIDGRNQRGESLPSGIYFIRGTLSEGDFKQIITILK